jgi:hypothetical protein
MPRKDCWRNDGQDRSSSRSPRRAVAAIDVVGRRMPALRLSEETMAEPLSFGLAKNI